MSSFSCYTHHICSPTDTACFFDSRIWYIAKEYHEKELKFVAFHKIFIKRQWVFIFFVKLQYSITATFVCFLDNQQWIIHYWNILYFSFNRLCTSTGVGSSYSRVTSLLSWIVIYRTQPSPQMNEYKTWIKWTNESAKAYSSCYIQLQILPLTILFSFHICYQYIKWNWSYVL